MNRERRPFVVRVDVSEQFLAEQPDVARGLADSILRDKARELLTGPRGGRYLPDSDPYDFRDGPDSDAFHRPRHVFVASVVGRYVRPSRSSR